ncbi:unnamed protein product [Spodoptera exigua]|nr:unnamed protein product [Spodoptera exigua]
MTYNIDFTYYVMWVHQAIALRLVGLAFEITLAEKTRRQPPTAKGAQASKAIKLSKEPDVNSDVASKGSNHRLNDLPLMTDPTAIDIISYAYYFIGLHKDYRYLYNIPQMLAYVLQYQVVILLCTSVYTEAGFGVYPTKTQPLPGHGPSARYSLLQLATVKEQVALEQEYNFAMLRSFENEKLLIGPRMRDTLRCWDMSTRYWFWAHTYKGISKANKEVRSALSFLAWTVWCGPTLQQLIISSTLWVHLHLENEYDDLYDTHVLLKIPWDIGFSIMRLFCLAYLTPCLILRDSTVILRYYNSIYWVYHVVLFFLILGAVVVHKERFMSRHATVVV